MRRIRDHMTYANVMATLAVFLVLGGGAYAAIHLPRNSVSSRNIKNGEVKSQDVEDHGLSAKDLKVASLLDATSGRTKANSICGSLSSSFNPCADTEVKLNRPSKLFATGDAVADSGAPAVLSNVHCALFADGNQFGTDIDIDVAFADGALSVSGVSQKLGRGTHAIELDCHGPSNSSPRVFHASLSAVILGTG